MPMDFSHNWMSARDNMRNSVTEDKTSKMMRQCNGTIIEVKTIVLRASVAVASFCALLHRNTLDILYTHSHVWSHPPWHLDARQLLPNLSQSWQHFLGTTEDLFREQTTSPENHICLHLHPQAYQPKHPQHHMAWHSTCITQPTPIWCAISHLFDVGATELQISKQCLIRLMIVLLCKALFHRWGEATVGPIRENCQLCLQTLKKWTPSSTPNPNLDTCPLDPSG